MCGGWRSARKVNSKNSRKRNTRSSNYSKNYWGHYLTTIAGERAKVFSKKRREYFETRFYFFCEKLTWIKQIFPLPPVDRVEHLGGEDDDPLAQRRAALRRRRVPPAGGAHPSPEDPGGQLRAVGAPLGRVEGVGELGEDGGGEGVAALEAEDTVRWFLENCEGTLC